MDGAWALYEAWVKIQTGEADTALVYGYGKSSPGDLRDVLTRQLDPYYLAPLWPDSRGPGRPAGPGLHRRRGHPVERDGRDRRPQPAVGGRQPPRPAAGVRRSGGAAEGARDRRAAAHATTARRSPTAPPPSILAAGDRARELADTAGLDPGHRPPHRGPRPRRPRPDRLAVDPPRGREGGRRRRRRSTSPSCTPRSPTRRSSLRRALGLGDDVTVNPSGGAAGRQPDDGRRPDPHRRGRQPHQPAARPAGRWPTPPAARACNRTWCACSKGSTERWARNRSPSSASARPTTRPPAATCRSPGWSARPPLEALEDAGMTWADIDAVVIGKAPDFFEGVMMPELYLADALGAVGKPHAAGPHRRLGRRLDRPGGRQPGPGRHPPAGADGRLREAVRERGHVGADAAHPVLAAAGGRAPAATSPRTSGPTCAARARPTTSACWWPSRTGSNALKNPKAHLHEEDITLRVGEGLDHAVGPDPLLRDLPVLRRRLRHGAHRRGRAATPPPTRRGCWAAPCAPSRRCSPGRDQVNPPGRHATARPTSTARPASPTRAATSTWPRSTCRSRGTSRCGSRTSASPRRARAGSSSRTGPPPWTATSPGTLGRRAVVQPDRRLGHDPLRRGRAPGAGQGRRAPDRRRPRGARPRLRRRLAVLRHVGRRRPRSRRPDGPRTARRQGRASSPARARGQGEAEARLFAAEGAKVVLADVLDEEGEKAAADIGDAAALHPPRRHRRGPVGRGRGRWPRTAFGPVYVLVNNAGVLHFQAVHKIDARGLRPGHADQRARRVPRDEDGHAVDGPGRRRARS